MRVVKGQLGLSHTNAARSIRRGLFSVLWTLWSVVRFVVYSVLALFERVIVGGLTLVAIVLIAALGFYGFLQMFHPSHFPFVMVSIWVVLCGLVASLYYALMYLLQPGDEG